MVQAIRTLMVHIIILLLWKLNTKKDWEKISEFGIVLVQTINLTGSINLGLIDFQESEADQLSILFGKDSWCCCITISVGLLHICIKCHPSKVSLPKTALCNGTQSRRKKGRETKYFKTSAMHCGNAACILSPFLIPNQATVQDQVIPALPGLTESSRSFAS